MKKTTPADRLRRLRVDLDDAGYIGTLDADAVERLASALDREEWDEHAWKVLRIKEALRHLGTSKEFGGTRYGVRAVSLGEALARLRPRGAKA